MVDPAVAPEQDTGAPARPADGSRGPIVEGDPALPAVPGVDEAIEVAPPETAHEEVLVLDFGGQYSQLIARRIRECGVYAELLPHDLELEKIRDRSPAALVLSGGPASVYSPARSEAARECSSSGSRCPASVTGCRRWCSSSAAGSREPRRAEFGRTALTLAGDGGRLLTGLPAEQRS